MTQADDIYARDQLLNLISSGAIFMPHNTETYRNVLEDSRRGKLDHKISKKLIHSRDFREWMLARTDFPVLTDTCHKDLILCYIRMSKLYQDKNKEIHDRVNARLKAENAVIPCRKELYAEMLLHGILLSEKWSKLGHWEKEFGG